MGYLKTGKLMALCSCKSLHLPSNTTPLAPRWLALVLIRPPQLAFTMPGGMDNTTTLPAVVESAQCPGGGPKHVGGLQRFLVLDAPTHRINGRDLSIAGHQS